MGPFENTKHQLLPLLKILQWFLLHFRYNLNYSSWPSKDLVLYIIIPCCLPSGHTSPATLGTCNLAIICSLAHELHWDSDLFLCSWLYLQHLQNWPALSEHSKRIRAPEWIQSSYYRLNRLLSSALALQFAATGDLPVWLPPSENKGWRELSMS
jgi:hypothetical protein